MSSGRAKKERREQKETDEQIRKEVWSMPPTIIVTGYPRSGTTAMMRILYHGGIELIAEDRDEEGRKKTRHTYWPYGDAEVKNLDAWRAKNPDPRVTSGKAIKVITPYLHHYFADRPIRVIFMLRDMTEIITSLLRIASIWPMPPDESVRLARKVLTDRGVPVVYIKYTEMLKYPKSTATQVADFIQMDFDIEESIKAVDQEARTKMSDPRKEPLLTFQFDYVRDFRGNKDDPLIPLNEDAKRAQEEYEAETRKMARKKEAA